MLTAKSAELDLELIMVSGLESGMGLEVCMGEGCLMTQIANYLELPKGSNRVWSWVPLKHQKQGEIQLGSITDYGGCPTLDCALSSLLARCCRAEIVKDTGSLRAGVCVNSINNIS
jgi:hypothetical protein